MNDPADNNWEPSELEFRQHETIEKLQARIQQLETYSRCDAETIEQLQGRVAELETENARLVESLHKLIGKKSTLVTSKLPQ